jgi:hypothetical protein
MFFGIFLKKAKIFFKWAILGEKRGLWPQMHTDYTVILATNESARRMADKHEFTRITRFDLVQAVLISEIRVERMVVREDCRADRWSARNDIVRRPAPGGLIGPEIKRNKKKLLDNAQ